MQACLPLLLKGLHVMPSRMVGSLYFNMGTTLQNNMRITEHFSSLFFLKKKREKNEKMCINK